MATSLGQVKRSRPAVARDLHLPGTRIEEGVLHGRVPPRCAAKHQPPIQRGQHIRRRLPRFVNAAQRADCQRRIHRGGQALAGHVTELQTNAAIGHLEIVEKIAAHFRDGLKLVRDSYAARP